MKQGLIEILDSIPTEVNHSDIIDFKNFYERVSAVGVIYANTIGVSIDKIEFCPNNEPPSKGEILSWIWSFRPDLTDAGYHGSISATHFGRCMPVISVQTVPFFLKH